MSRLVSDKQAISAVYGSPDVEPAPQVLYTFQYRAESSTTQDVMKAKLELLMHDAKVKEH